MDQRVSVMLAEQAHEEDFLVHLERESMRIITWLDTDAAPERAVRPLESP